MNIITHSNFSMKIIRNVMKVWLFIFYLNILIFLPDKIGSMNKKLQKSFTEIFGEGWEEKGTEEAKLEDAGKKDPNGNGHNQHYLNQINEKATDQNDSGHKNGDQSESDQQKREIIRKFYAIKEKIKQKGIKCSVKERNKSENTIAKKLGTSRKFLYELIKEFGMGKRNKKLYSKKQKIEIVQKFTTMCNEYKQKRTYSTKEWAQNYDQISKKVGVCRATIKKWKKEIGMVRKSYTKDEKLELMKRYWEMKRKNPKISDRKIVKKLKIDAINIRRWKGKFRENEI